MYDLEDMRDNLLLSRWHRVNTNDIQFACTACNLIWISICSFLFPLNRIFQPQRRSLTSPRKGVLGYHGETWITNWLVPGRTWKGRPMPTACRLSPGSPWTSGTQRLLQTHRKSTTCIWRIDRIHETLRSCKSTIQLSCSHLIGNAFP
jgi:hypothetical protein